MVFIPRWEKYKDKKPTGLVEVDWNHRLAQKVNFVMLPDLREVVQSKDKILSRTYGTYQPATDHYIEFDTSLNAEALAYTTGVNPTSGDISVFSIADTSNIVNIGNLVSRDSTYSTRDYQFRIDSDGTFRTIQWPGVIQYTASATKDLHSFLWNKRGTTNEMFVDNTLTSASGAASVITSSNSVLTIGGRFQGPGSGFVEKFNGKVYLSIEFFDALTLDESYELIENPYQILKPRKTFFTFSTTTSSSQTLTPTLFTNTNTFYSPSANTGTVSLQPSVFNNTSSFYTPTVATSNNLQADLLTNTQTFYNQTVTTSNTLQADVLSNTNSFYSHTLAGGSVALQPLLFTNNNTVYSATVIQGTATLQPALVSNENSFLSPTVSTSYTLQSGLVTNANSFYTQQLSASYALQPTLVSNTSEFYTPAVSTSYTLQSDVLTNTSVFYNAIVSNEGSKVLVPERFDNTSLFYTPTLTTGTVLVQPNRFDNIETFYTTTVTSTYPLQPSLYTNTSTFNTHTVSAGTVTLQSDLFVQTNNFYSATIVLGSGTQFIQPTLFENTNAFFSGVVAIEQFIVPSLFTNTNSFNTHVIIDASLYKEIVEFNVSFKQLNETQHNIQQDNLSSSYIKQVESFQTEL